MTWAGMVNGQVVVAVSDRAPGDLLCLLGATVIKVQQVGPYAIS
jgi:hypothetical protein